MGSESDFGSSDIVYSNSILCIDHAGLVGIWNGDDMIFVMRVSRWFRFKLWCAIKCMQLANWALRTRPKLAQEMDMVPLTDVQMAQMEKEVYKHTIQ